MVFLLPWGLSFYKEEEVKEAESPLIIPPKKEALLLIEDKGEALIFLHLKLSLNKCEIKALSPDFKAQDTDGFLPLYKIEENGGLKYAVRALNKDEAFKIDFYSCFDIKSLEEALKNLGSCDFFLPSAIKGQNEETFFQKGRTLLNIEDAALILRKAESPSGEKRRKIFTDIVSQLFEQRGDIGKKDQESIFLCLANGRESNLSIKNFLNFKKYGIFSKDFRFMQK